MTMTVEALSPKRTEEMRVVRRVCGWRNKWQAWFEPDPRGKYLMLRWF